jgi:hypothetical protein
MAVTETERSRYPRRQLARAHAIYMRESTDHGRIQKCAHQFPRFGGIRMVDVHNVPRDRLVNF